MAPPRPLLTLVIERTERLTPHLHRLVLGGPGFDDFRTTEFTDQYVKLVVPRPDVDYPEPFTMETVQAALPRHDWPAIRTYTVRRHDPVAREVWIDVVLHGDRGIAGPWAAAAQPGDLVHLRGPGGAYRPDPTADHHLLAGDSSALPAIASALEALPPDAAATVIVEIDEPADELDLAMPAAASLTWLHRSAAHPGFADAVRALPTISGRVQAFVHGELHATRSLRSVLLDRGVAAEDLSLSGYWRHGKDEDGFQAEKRELATAET